MMMMQGESALIGKLWKQEEEEEKKKQPNTATRAINTRTNVISCYAIPGGCQSVYQIVEEYGNMGVWRNNVEAVERKKERKKERKGAEGRVKVLPLFLIADCLFG